MTGNLRADGVFGWRGVSATPLFRQVATSREDICMTAPARFDFSGIPVVDHHSHNWRRETGAYDAEGFRALFVEQVDPGVAARAGETIYYRWSLRELARALDCDPTEAAVIARRAELGHDAVRRRLMSEANVAGAVIDHLFAGRGAEILSTAEMGPALGGAVTAGALRLEVVLQDLIVSHDTLSEVEEAFRAMLDAEKLRADGIVSLKSIAAYRTGLDIMPTPRVEARASFNHLRSEAKANGRIRLADKPFLDYFLGVALEFAGRAQFPFQFHTGFGDSDVDLRTGNPIALRPVLENPAYRGAQIVLLHAGWPYVRETSYLASIYPNVWADVGLAIPFAATAYTAIWRDLLSLAPTSKVLWSSDAFTIPEHVWFAAVHGRRALAAVLGGLVDLGALAPADVWPIARQILRDNAVGLYGLDGVRNVGDAAPDL